MGRVKQVGIVSENYNQHKANLTGDTYYQVTCEAFGCNLWAVDEENAKHVVYSFWPDLLGKELTVKVIVEPEGKGDGDVRKNVYSVLSSNLDYAEYNQLLIVAVNETEALEIATESGLFNSWQLPLIVEEIDLTKSDIIGMEGLDV